MTWFYCWHQTWLDCCVGGRNRRDLSGDDFISVWGSELTWFCVGVGNDLVWSLDRNTLNFRVGGHVKLTWFSLDKVNLVFVSGGMQNWLVFRVGIQIDLTSVLGPKWTYFFVGDRKWLGFSVRTEIVMFFVRGSKLTFLCAGRKVLVFSVSMEIDLVLVMVVDIDLISVWGIELDLISV